MQYFNQHHMLHGTFGIASYAALKRIPLLNCLLFNFPAHHKLRHFDSVWFPIR